jgi:hypothetical protein
MAADPWYLPVISPLLSGIVGASLVYYFGIRQISIKRHADFVERQLQEFYAPMAGWRKRIRSKSELRLRVSGAANQAWHEICESYGGAVMHDHEERFKPFKRIIEYDNDQFERELMPLYRQMLDLFTDKYWLAAKDTRGFYQEYLEFVEIWERYLGAAIPGEVIKKLGHSEENVKPFYDHVENKLQQLQEEVADLKPWWKRLV